MSGVDAIPLAKESREVGVIDIRDLPATCCSYQVNRSTRTLCLLNRDAIRNDRLHYGRAAINVEEFITPVIVLLSGGSHPVENDPAKK